MPAPEPSAPPPGSAALPRIAGLDGIRALSVLAVCAYHAEFEWARGGYLGVEVFFVLSGFLITSLLLAEHHATGGIDLKRFWLRRARRLLPALYTFLVGAWILALTLAPDALGRLRSQTWAALLYVTNWQLALQQLSYFESLDRPSFLLHLWSLAVEEQFYLLWPLALVFGIRRLGMERVLRLAVALIVLCTLAMALQYDSVVDADNSAIYMRTDTRAPGLLVGAVLAWLWRPWSPDWTPDRGVRALRWAEPLGVAALVGLLGLFATLSAQGPWLYRGGFLLTSSTTALLVASIALPGSRLGRRLDGPVLRWIGVRSYGLYLWHWPVFQVTRPRQDVLIDPWPLFALRMFVSLVLADASYRFIEDPIRRRRLGAALRGLPARLRTARGVAVAAGSVAALLASGYLLAAPQVGAGPSLLSAGAWTGLATDRPRRFEHVAVIGDSIVDEARFALAGLAPVVDVDANTGRGWTQGAVAARAIGRAGLAEAVVIHLGTNGDATADLIDAVLRPLAGVQRVVLVTTRTPARWEGEHNRLLLDAAPRYPNARIADWHALSDDHIDWFQPDGIHLSIAGLRAYMELLDRAVHGD